MASKDRLFVTSKEVDITSLMTVVNFGTDETVVALLMGYVNEAMGGVQDAMIAQGFVPAGEGGAQASRLTIHFECKGTPKPKEEKRG